jgi:hypothetical protein
MRNIGSGAQQRPCNPDIWTNPSYWQQYGTQRKREERPTQTFCRAVQRLLSRAERLPHAWTRGDGRTADKGRGRQRHARLLRSHLKVTGATDLRRPTCRSSHHVTAVARSGRQPLQHCSACAFEQLPPRHAFQNAVKRSLVDVCLLGTHQLTCLRLTNRLLLNTWRCPACASAWSICTGWSAFDAPTCVVVVGRDRFLTAPSTRHSSRPPELSYSKRASVSPPDAIDETENKRGWVTCEENRRRHEWHCGSVRLDWLPRLS